MLNVCIFSGKGLTERVSILELVGSAILPTAVGVFVCFYCVQR